MSDPTSDLIVYDYENVAGIARGYPVIGRLEHDGRWLGVLVVYDYENVT